MFPACHRLSGECVADPDTCLTPIAGAIAPVPIAYLNTGICAEALTFSLTVLIVGGNALNMASVLAMSHGDEPGVEHPTFMGPCSFVSGNPLVVIEGTPGVMLTSATLQNKTNAEGAVLIPSATNVIYGFKPADPSAAREALAIEEELNGSSRELVSRLVPGGIGYIALRVFSGGSPARVHGAMRELSERGMASLIIDLRGNPGGEVAAAIELAGDFLARGSVIATLVDADGDETVYRAHGEILYEVPVAILVDRRTASASELFAGSLRAHGRAVIIGETTYGKGHAQALVPSIEGSRYGTVARVVLPDGSEFQGDGIQPDIRMNPPEGSAPA